MSREPRVLKQLESVVVVDLLILITILLLNFFYYDGLIKEM